MEIKKTKKSLEKKVEKVYFLIHPAYVSICGSRRRLYTSLHLFKRWRKKIDEIGEKEILIVLAASHPTGYKKGDMADREVLKYTKKLGRRCFAFFAVPSAEKIADLLKARKLVINPKTVESEAFGEYYQFCVAGYASRYNRELKLRKPTYINKELSYNAGDLDIFDDIKRDPYITFQKQNKQDKQDKTR